MGYVTHRELEDALAATARGIGQAIRESSGGAAVPSKQQTLRLQTSRVQKFVSAGKRVIRGVASTSSCDLQGDIVIPTGGKWTLPVPLLYAHDSLTPIGWVREITATRDALHVVCEVATGVGKADEIFAMLEAQLVSAFSIGFIGTKGKPIATGTQWDEWTLIELSCVVCGANQGARITATRAQSGGAIKLIDPRRCDSIPLVRSTR